MGLFAKAAEKKSKTAAKPKKNTTWVVGDPDGDAVGKAVHELVELTAQEKAIKAKKNIFANQVANHAKDHHVRDFCDLGVAPDTPMVVQNSDGEKVTFVVQDRGGQYNVKEEQQDALAQLLGADAAADLLFTETTLGFDRTILAIPGVSDVIEGALQRAVTKLIKEKTVTEEQADELITAKVKTSFKPGTLDRAATIVGRDTTKLAAFLDAMGSSCTRYIKT
jgi:hypothetical protein